MVKRYLKTTSILILLLAMTVGSAQAFSFGKGRGVKGSGDMETRELDLDSFDAIDIGGAFDLLVTFGDQQKVEVTIDDNLWDILEADVSGGELEIDWDKNCRPSEHCKVEIVVKSLSSVSIHGACDAEIKDFKGDSFEYNLSGAGNLEMDGKVDRLEIKVSGAGNADTRDLEAKHVKVSVSGAGDVDVFASESIRARVSGVGSVKYYGDPEEKDTKVSGIGSIKHR